MVFANPVTQVCRHPRTDRDTESKMKFCRDCKMLLSKVPKDYLNPITRSN